MMRSVISSMFSVRRVRKKKKKLKKMDFFDPPSVALQKSKFIEINDGYLCRTKTKTCSLNLTLSGAEK